MKQVFYTGLLALTVAFGMTSCDKNELPDAPSVGVIVNDEYSKVSFEEVGNSIVVPKLKSDAASKSAAQFAHIYSTNDQVLTIGKQGETAIYNGTYTPNNIGSISPSSIILVNDENYIAESMNSANSSDDVVLGFLPYTSRVEFDLAESKTITLEATLLRGFLIVNVEDALENGRVQSATVQVGEGDKTSLILDDDATGDYYGYLQDGTYDVDVTYLLDGNEVIISAEDKVISAGSAYTIDLSLNAERVDVIDSVVSTSTEAGTEAALALKDPPRADGGDVNDDGDVIDTLERIVTSTQATLNGENDGVAVVTRGAWSIVLNNSAVVPSETTTPTTDDGSVVNGVDTFSAWSAWSPENDADTSVAEIVQTRTRTIVFVDAEDVPAPAGDLSETQTVDNPLYSAPAVDPTDAIVPSVGDAVLSGGVSSVSTGTFGAWVVVAADADVEFTSRSRSRIITTSVTEQISTITTTYSVVVAGVEDIPALVAPVDLVVPTTVADASSLDATDTETEDNFMNPDYVAPAAEWGTSDVALTIGGIDYVILYSNSDFSYGFVIDNDPFSGTISYLILDSSNAAVGNLVSAATEEAAIAAAKAAIALL